MFISEHAFTPDVSRSVFIGLLIKPKNIFLRPFVSSYHQSITLTVRQDDSMMEVSCFSEQPVASKLINKTDVLTALSSNMNIQLMLNNAGFKVDLPYSIFDWLFKGKHEEHKSIQEFGIGQNFELLIDDNLNIRIAVSQVDYHRHHRVNDLTKNYDFN